jgi:hypothetical protein
MENSSGNQTHRTTEKDWHRISKKGVLIGLTNKSIVNKLTALRDEIESDFVAGKLEDPTNLQKKIDAYKEIKGDFYKYWEGALADRGSQSGQGNSNNSGKG